jgi:cytochrome c oxidase subunit 4
LDDPSRPTREPAAHRTWPVRYLVCWVALALLTFATFALAHVGLGAWSLGVALTIASGKALIVALFFMHLWDQRGANRLVFAASIAFVLLLMALVLVDVATRFPPALSNG